MRRKGNGGPGGENIDIRGRDQGAWNLGSVFRMLGWRLGGLGFKFLYDNSVKRERFAVRDGLPTGELSVASGGGFPSVFVAIRRFVKAQRKRRHWRGEYRH